jgi:cysteine desulfurase / selenocysteine lyase
MTEALSARSEYPALNEAVYLNQASLGLIGQSSVQAMHHFLDNVARHGNFRMTDEAEVGFFESLRTQGAKMLNCPPDQLAIIGSASELLGQLPLIIRPRPGSHFLAVSSDFPAVTRPWNQYAREHKCLMEFVDDRADRNLTEALVARITERTSVVAIGSVQFATGTSLDIPRLRDATEAAGASLIVDVTQAAGVLPIDAGTWGADAVVTSGYKWLGGHGGVALGVLGSKWLGRSPALPGWMSTPDPFDFAATRLEYASGGRRYTQSTMSYVSLVGLTASLGALLKIGGQRTVDHAASLRQRLVDGASALGWEPFRKEDDESAAPHIVSLAHPEIESSLASRELRRLDIVCGARRGRVRVSLAPYNTSGDIDVLIDALSSIDSLGSARTD